MIRDSRPTDEDTAAIARLCIAQYRRTPWDIANMSSHIHGWRLCDRGGRITGAMSYTYAPHRIYAQSFWVDDGLAGARAAVELGRDMVKMARQLRRELLFGVNVTNVPLQKAVARYGYAPRDGGDYGPSTLLFGKAR